MKALDGELRQAAANFGTSERADSEEKIGRAKRWLYEQKKSSPLPVLARNKAKAPFLRMLLVEMTPIAQNSVQNY